MNSVKKQRLLPLIAALVVIGAASAPAADVKVIANASVRADSITGTELKSVYLEERGSLRDGSHVEPVLAKSGAAHDAFLKLYLGMSDEGLQNYYRSLVFTGKGSMPKMLNSDTDVVDYVRKTRGAIGYVNNASTTDGVKTLLIQSEHEKGERKLVTRVAPKYSDTLRHMGIGGTVRLRVTISPKGSVEKVVLLGGNPILAEAATDAVKQWVYTPGASHTDMEISIPFDPKL